MCTIEAAAQWLSTFGSVTEIVVVAKGVKPKKLRWPMSTWCTTFVTYICKVEIVAVIIT